MADGEEGSIVTKIAGGIAALLFVFAIGGAGAEEVRGKIKTLDQNERVFTLEDGTQIWIAEGVSMLALKEGTSVKAAYEERDGKKIGISIDVTSRGAGAARSPR